MDNYININSNYSNLGQYEKALPYGQKAVELQPEDSIASQNLVADYIGLNRMAEARTELERARKLGLGTSTSDLVTHMRVFFLLGEPKEVQRTMALAAGRPDQFLATQALAGTQQFSGQYRRAEATIQHAFEQAGRAKAPDVQAAVLLTTHKVLNQTTACHPYRSGPAVPSISIRFGRKQLPYPFVIPTGAKRSGGTCGFFPARLRRASSGLSTIATVKRRPNLMSSRPGQRSGTSPTW